MLGDGSVRRPSSFTSEEWSRTLVGVSAGSSRWFSSAKGRPMAFPMMKGMHRMFKNVTKMTFGATIVAGLVLGGGTAANAQWGETTPSYCSSSTGCYTVDGQAVTTTYGPQLTSRENQLRLECNLRLAGTGFAGAGGIMSGNWLAIIGAAFNGGSALVGPCQDLWNSTARYRS